MGGNSTIYDVKVRYAIDGDKASGGLKEIARHADKAGESLFSIKHAMEALAIKEVFHLGKEALIDFNSEIDQMKIGMTTVMQMNLHMPFEKANKEADKLFETFQALAKKSPLTTKDFMEMATAISPAIAMAGGGPDKLAKITSGALTAGLAYGQRPDIVAMDVQEMMMGNVTKRNRLGNELLGSIGMEHGEFNKKNASERATLVEKMFSQEGLQKAADRFGETFQGQISTLKDNLQISLGQVGRPLMESLTAEVKKWNDYLEKHPKLIKETISEISEVISSAFSFVKSVTSFLVDNRDILFTIGKTFLVFKGSQLAGNIFKKFGDGIGSLTDTIKSAANGIGGLFNGEGFSGLGSISGVFGLFSKAIPIVGGLISAFQILGVVMDNFSTHRQADLLAEERRRSVHEAVGDIPGLLARRTALEDTLKGKGIMGGMASNEEMKKRFSNELDTLNDKIFNPQRMGEAIKKLSDEAKEHGAGHRGFEDMTMGQFAQLSRFTPDMFDYRSQDESKKVTEEFMSVAKLFENMTTDMREQALKYAFPEQFGKPNMDAPKQEEPWKNLGPDKSNINVTIQKIEVASEDPDRFVFGLAKIGEQATKHPTQSQHTIPGGF
jgi:hypothetical protein